MLPDIDNMVMAIALDVQKRRLAVLGGSWTESGLPPETGENTEADLNGDGNNNLKYMRSRSGHLVIFDDTEGEEKVQVISADGKTRFEFSPAEETGNLETENDITLSAKGTIMIEAEEIEIAAEKNGSSLTCMKRIL
ncbi:MAG: hypothetical protein LBQ88_12990 [Treponema sp.]|nr:hypothetical protein [Treponema sp.]